jgi:hypothetical protein
LYKNDHFPLDTQSASPRVLWATEDMAEALQAGKMELAARDQMEIDHPGVPLPPSHPSSLHRKAMFSSPESGEASRVGTILLAATRSFSK